MGDTAVIYITRKANHPRYSRAFLRSLIRNDPGRPFKLLYVLKGFGPKEDDPALMHIMKDLPCSIEIARFEDTVTPLEIFFELARKTELFLALNSWSRILTPNWLSAYTAAFESQDCGIVGATGSFEMVPGMHFPNAALRTNAFMMRGTLVPKLDLSDIQSRTGNLRFEAGPNNFTQQILNLGLKVYVVDRNATLYAPNKWPQSRTFRSGGQERLIIADNRTAHYDYASTRRRHTLAEAAFGSAGEIKQSRLHERLLAWVRWHYPNGINDLKCALFETGVKPK